MAVGWFLLPFLYVGLKKNKHIMLSRAMVIFSIVLIPLYKSTEARMMLPLTALVALVAAYGVWTLPLRRLWTALILSCMIVISVMSYETYEVNRLETQVAKEIEEMVDGLVITEFPSVLHSTTGLKAVPTRVALAVDQLPSPIYYFEDQFCTGSKVSLREARMRCHRMHEKYDLEVLHTFSSSLKLYMVAEPVIGGAQRDST
jgi:hypothetical protein